MRKSDKKKAMEDIDCLACKSPSCCRVGAWIDLEEAKKILSLGIKGDFFHLEMDKDFPSGFRIGTSYEDDPCTFLRPDGLCAIHKADYSHKPKTCREFPYENKKISPYADVLCSMFKSRTKSGKRTKK